MIRYLKYRWLLFLLSYRTKEHNMRIGLCHLDWVKKYKLDFNTAWNKGKTGAQKSFLSRLRFLYFAGAGIGPEHKVIITYLLRKASKQRGFKKSLNQCGDGNRYYKIEGDWNAIDIIYLCYKAKRREDKNVS